MKKGLLIGLGVVLFGLGFLTSVGWSETEFQKLVRESQAQTKQYSEEWAECIFENIDKANSDAGAIAVRQACAVVTK